MASGVWGVATNIKAFSLEDVRSLLRGIFAQNLVHIYTDIILASCGSIYELR